MITARKPFARFLNPKLFNAPVPAALRQPLVGGAILFLFLGAGIYDLYEMRNYLPVPLTGLGNAARQALYLVPFTLAVFSLRLNQDLRQLLVLPASMTLLLAWCWISSLWAVDFSIAVRRLVLTTITIWTLFISAEHAGYERAIRMTRWLFLATLVLNYLNVMTSPLAIEQVGDFIDPAIAGTWRGILPQKNFAGATSAILILLYLFGPRKSLALSHTLFKWAAIAASAYFLYRTNSRTSMGVLAISIFLGVTYNVFGVRNRLWLIPLFCGACLAAGLMAIPFLNLIYDPSAFSGRSQIWLMLLRYIREHMWLGSGFGSFWNIGDASPVYHYTRGWIAKVTASGHNGYLDLVVQLGIPGFLLTMMAMVVQPLRILLANRSISTHQGAMLVVGFFFCIGHNFTESTLLTTNVIVELFFLIVLALIFQAGRAAPAGALQTPHDFAGVMPVPLAQRHASQIAAR